MTKTGQRKVIIRADGSSTIGMGHFIRSLALAEMLNKHFNCIFATRTPTDYQVAEIEKICNERIDLPGDESHFQVFQEQLKGDEIVVLDNYYFDTDYQRAIKNKGCKLVCIDDMHDKHFVADIVINHAEGIDQKEYSIEENTKLLLGYKYALLRPDFLRAAKQKRSFESSQLSVIINLGGSDPKELVIKTTNIFLKHPAISVVNLVSQVDFNKLHNPQNKKVNQYWNLTAKELSNIMLQSAIGFLPASTISIEACACRLPFIGGWFVHNQVNIYNAIMKNRLAIGIENINKLSEEYLFEAISEIIKSDVTLGIISQQNIIIDGRSDKRIRKAIQSIC
jgi:UDP-2,4-diacetamido-2,4,6-trideoxy-beta-L-altropyranose hydrolase